eukprot:gene1130-4350_t
MSYSVQVHRAPNERWPFEILKEHDAVYVSSSSHKGLNIHDEIIAVNGLPIKAMPIDILHNLMDTVNTLQLTVKEESQLNLGGPGEVRQQEGGFSSRVSVQEKCNKQSFSPTANQNVTLSLAPQTCDSPLSTLSLAEASSNSTEAASNSKTSHARSTKSSKRRRLPVLPPNVGKRMPPQRLGDVVPTSSTNSSRQQLQYEQRDNVIQKTERESPNQPFQQNKEIQQQEHNQIDREDTRHPVLIKESQPMDAQLQDQSIERVNNETRPHLADVYSLMTLHDTSIPDSQKKVPIKKETNNHCLQQHANFAKHNFTFAFQAISNDRTIASSNSTLSSRSVSPTISELHGAKHPNDVPSAQQSAVSLLPALRYDTFPGTSPEMIQRMGKSTIYNSHCDYEDDQLSNVSQFGPKESTSITKDNRLNTQVFREPLDALGVTPYFNDFENKQLELSSPHALTHKLDPTSSRIASLSETTSVPSLALMQRSRSEASSPSGDTSQDSSNLRQSKSMHRLVSNPSTASFAGIGIVDANRAMLHDFLKLRASSNNLAKPLPSTSLCTENEAFQLIPTYGEILVLPYEHEPGNIVGFQVIGGIDTAYGAAFVSVVMPNTRAAVAGLKTGDRLLAIDSVDLIGATHKEATSIIQSVGHIVDLFVQRLSTSQWRDICRNARRIELGLERLNLLTPEFLRPLKFDSDKDTKEGFVGKLR